MCSISITNMTNHDNTATFCEIRNCVDILLNLGMVSHRVSTVMDFDGTQLFVLVYTVGGYWIITYVKKYGNTSVYIISIFQCFIWK